MGNLKIKTMETEVSFTPLTSQECNSRLGAVSDALYVIGGKWKLRIIIAISEGRTRFNDIQRVLGISAKMLSSELKELEMNGFVKRIVHIGTPVIVYYERTDYTETLKDILVALSDWGTMHREKLRREG